MDDSQTIRTTGRLENYTRGVLLLRQGRFAEALDELGRFEAPQGLIARLTRYYQAMCHRAIGLEALRTGDFERAQSHLRQAMRIAGGGADLSSYLAAAYAQTGQYSRCAGELEKTAGSAQSSVETLRLLALAQWRAGRRCQAYLTLSEGLRRLGGHSRLHMQMGLFYAAEERFAEARASLARAAEGDCTNADTHYYLALAASAQGDLPAAVRSLQRAFELRPTDLMIAYQLAMAARAAGDGGYHIMLRLPETTAPANLHGSQIRELGAYVAAEPDFIDAFLALPPSEVDDELFGLLLGVVQMALADHPRYADLQYRCSCVLMRLGRRDEAMVHARQAVEINPRYRKALVHLARLTAEAGQVEPALAWLDKALAAGADYADVHCLAGELLQHCNRSDRARRHFARALELNRKYTRASDGLGAVAA